VARRGVLVRHLVMPGGTEDTARILRWLAEELHPDTYVNVMDQYHPAGLVTRAPERYADLYRRITSQELRDAVSTASSLGLRLDTRRPPATRARPWSGW
jgi:putative pyruvate formate lyase activating enzyme